MSLNRPKAPAINRISRLSATSLSSIVHKTFAESLSAIFNMSATKDVTAVPEYYFTVKIAEALAVSLAKDRIVRMEWPASTLISSADAIQPGRLARHIRHNGRADISIFSRGYEQPEAVIEVKRHVYSACSGPEADIQRLTATLARAPHRNSIRYGLFAFSTFTNVNDAKARIQHIKSRLAHYHQIADRGGLLKITTSFKEVTGLECDDHVLTGVSILQRA